MRYHTHLVTSLTAGVTTTTFTDLSLSAPLIGGLLIGSLLPDIDEPKSFIGRRSLGISKIFSTIFGHRGFTHSLLATCMIGSVIYFFPNNFTIGLTLGFLFHILGDFFSKSGVPLLHPFRKKRYKIPIYTTGGMMENVILVSSIVLLFLLFR